MHTAPHNHRDQSPAPVANRRRARQGLFLAVALLALTFGFALLGCSTAPTTCAQLKTAADAAHCPERTVETTVTKFEAVDVGEIPEAPPITAATVPDAAPVSHALQAIAVDLKAARAWGWTLYHKLMALDRAHTEGGTQ